MKRFLLILILIVGMLWANIASLNAQENEDKIVTDKKIETVVTAIKEKSTIIESGSPERTYQKLELLITSGQDKGKKIIVENGKLSSVNNQVYKVGDKVVVTVSKSPEGSEVFYITDYVRRDALLWIFGIFVGVTILIGRLRGLASFIGMGLSFIVIFMFILPQISVGRDPIFIAILSSFVIIPATFYLSHGVNMKTTAAVIGTFIALIVTGILATVFVDAARLTGFASEEAGFLEEVKQGAINIKGLLLAGIIIGVLGILDDVAISQSAIVFQLKKTSKSISFGELYLKAMDVGRDHIASVVNTLVLVYTGAAMPLLLLFMNNPSPLGEVWNYEMIAEEVVRTLVATIGLILAVPITTFISALFATRE